MKSKHLSFSFPILLEAFRFVLAMGIVWFLHYILLIITPLATLCISSAIGILLPRVLLRKNWTSWKVVVVHGTFFVVMFLLFWFAEKAALLLGAQSTKWDLCIALLYDHFTLLISFYLFSFTSSWLFWTWRPTGIVESFIAAVGAVWILSGHRNYHLDAPKNMSKLAWALHISPELLLLCVAGIFVIVVATYLLAASTRQIFRAQDLISHRGSGNRILTLTGSALVLLLLVGYGGFLKNRYENNLSRATNGVGQKNEEGKSPLGFHSAIGQTKQPAALVRLEGDYAQNPWSPMLYFREGALSEYNGHELVVASREFDTDVPRVRPGGEFITKPFAEKDRTTVVQSIYILAEHSNVFAIDYPERIRIIKNPDPQRFQLAYQATSMAPAFEKKLSVDSAVGDSSWNKETWDHYLRAPGSRSLTENLILPSDLSQSSPDQYGEDLRYRALVDQLTKSETQPIARATAIVQYLSASSIYTRQPGHSVAPNADPVAPYLFAEKKRGYCVHFAHAAVYLMRLAGIPARIATGYLTDLNYAKDGHILLQLGDRHAWPEIYVQDHGWVVLDINPASAENEQVAVPDEKLLEELMSKIDPSVEFSPPAVSTDAAQNRVVNFLRRLGNPKFILGAILLIVVTFVFAKSWLRFGYLFPCSPQTKVHRAYRSAASMLIDTGLPRAFGETHWEYVHRVANRGIVFSLLNTCCERIVYAPQAAHTGAGDLSISLREFRNSIRHNMPLWRNLFGLFSPLSVFYWKQSSW